MSRTSYGADIFSPLRSDSSLDDVSVSNRESDVFNEFSDNIQKDDKNKNRKRSIVKRSASHELKSAVKSNEALFCNIEIKTPERPNSTADNPAFITTRKKNSIDNKNSLVDDSFKIPKPRSIKEKVTITHATKRSESNKRVEPKSSRIRQSINPNSSSLPSVAEEAVSNQTYDAFQHDPSDLEIKDAGKAKNDKVVVNGSNNIEINKVIVKSVSSNASICSLNNTSDSFTDVMGSYEMAKDSSAKTDTFATVNNLHMPPTECFATPREPSASDSTSIETTKYSTHVKIPSPTGSNAPILSPESETCSESPREDFSNNCLPQPMSAGIIEKLVRDSIKFEFDHVRQILYSQQLSTMKYMDKNFIAAKENSNNVDVLIKIIEGLWEENQQLKRIIAQKCM